MAKTEKEIIQDLMMEVAGQNGSLAVQTIIYQMQQIIQGEEDASSLIGMKYHLLSLAEKATTIADNPEKWSSQGVYDGTLYYLNFVQQALPGDRALIDFGRVLSKLYVSYGSLFRIEGAQAYLHEVATSATMMIAEIDTLLGKENL